MRAIVTTEYGSVEVLEQQEIENTAIQGDEIFFHIYASSVNPVDWKIRKGGMKFLTGKQPPSDLWFS